MNVWQFILHGIKGFSDELKTNLGPTAMNFATAPVVDLFETRGVLLDDRIQKISDTLKEPIQRFTGGLLAVREWIPVLLVTTVEAYLKDVLIYAVAVDPMIMQSSEQSASYAEVTRAQSLEELTQELRSRWARNFVDDGGPDRWIKKLTRTGARGYRPETANGMETLWGVRHLIVHSSGVATAEFVRRHPEIRVKVGESILISSAQFTEWTTAVYDFVDVTDLYFVQRYGPGTVSSPV